MPLVHMLVSGQNRLFENPRLDGGNDFRLPCFLLFLFGEYGIPEEKVLHAEVHDAPAIEAGVKHPVQRLGNSRNPVCKINSVALLCIHALHGPEGHVLDLPQRRLFFLVGQGVPVLAVWIASFYEPHGLQAVHGGVSVALIRGTPLYFDRGYVTLAIHIVPAESLR